MAHSPCQHSLTMLQARGEALEHAKAKAHAETLARCTRAHVSPECPKPICHPPPATRHPPPLARQLQKRLDEIDAEDPMAPKPSAEERAAAAFEPLGAGRGVLPRVPVLASFVETLAETSREIQTLAEVTLKGMSKVEPLLISHLLDEEVVEEGEEEEEAEEAEEAEEPNPDAPDGEPAGGGAPQDATEEAAEAPSEASAEGAVAMPPQAPDAGESVLDDAPDAADSSTLDTMLGDTTEEVPELT